MSLPPLLLEAASEEDVEALVELERRYVVVGTSDERHETLFLGFRRTGDSWVLAELRTAP